MWAHGSRQVALKSLGGGGFRALGLRVSRDLGLKVFFDLFSAVPDVAHSFRRRKRN